jgi:uncharacterized membrane protein YdbT with pleckstrin-like domain
MKQLDKKAVWLFFFSSFFGTSVFSIFAAIWLFFAFGEILILDEGGFLDMGNVIMWAVIIAILFLIVAFIWAKLTYYFYRYELTEQGFRKESGVIWKKYVTIPYARIQNVDINRGILARILGLSDLQIQTAGASATFSQYGAIGGTNPEGRLPGVSKADAEILRDELVRRASKSSGQGV